MAEKLKTKKITGGEKKISHLAGRKEVSTWTIEKIIKILYANYIVVPVIICVSCNVS